MKPSSFESAIRLQFDCLIHKVIDEYSVEYTAFLVYGMEIHVYDEHLCKAIQKLKDRQRNIILMFYFLDMSDTEIGEIIGISRCSVYRGRMRALNIIRENYTEE